MPVDWPFAGEQLRLGGVGLQLIAAEDAARQEATAQAILSNLRDQPGVVLADEVGMGKTYVALAVVASVLLATRTKSRPVVVMMPPGLRGKWPREWSQFKQLCCSSRALDWVRDEYAHTPAELFRLLDDPKGRRTRLIWATTGCFNVGLQDPWIKLAFVRFARGRTKMDEENKKRLFKWATELVRLKSYRRLTPDLVERLLTTDVSRWRRLLAEADVLDEGGDDLVPEHLLRHQHQLDYQELVSVLRGQSIPGRSGPVSADRLTDGRRDLNDACQSLYWQWLRCVDWRAPLLVLDEAHHAKNDDTRLASLFRTPDLAGSPEDPNAERAVPLLREKFDRLLFLTATPFQLGHHELIRILQSFSAAKWTGSGAPLGTREDFLRDIEALKDRLDENRRAGRSLDRLWGRLRREEFVPVANDVDLATAVERWWKELPTEPADPRHAEIRRAVERCRGTRQTAESDTEQPWRGLRTWVVRHNRPAVLPRSSTETPTPRRDYRYGDAIRRDTGGAGGGVPLTAASALPFLLAARAQGELARGPGAGRALFAEGLASSFEAFHHTRERRGRAIDGEGEGQPTRLPDEVDQASHALVPVRWYETKVAALIPSKEASPKERYQHPKLQAVAEQALRLWWSGEKVLIFCFYIETARALRDHLTRVLEEQVTTRVAGKLDLGPDALTAGVRRWLERVSRRLADEDSPFSKTIHEVLRGPLKSPEFERLADKGEQLVALLAAFVRSPSFIARYLPLEVPDVRQALAEGEARPRIIRAGVEALSHALTEAADASAMSMTRRVQEFYRFAKDLAERGQRQIAVEGEEIPVDPLDEYLKAVAVYVGQRSATDDDGGEVGTYRALPVVRMVFGETKPAVRERLTLAFNSPLFPEILVSSAVMGEGVDLHRFCRHVIHHDLDWNPSAVEQRTGRIDRIRCKAEVSGRPIVIYEPYLAGSADEKKFRVLKDRERWFQIVMGQKFEFDEAASERLAERVPLPDSLAHDLIFDLSTFEDARAGDRTS